MGLYLYCIGTGRQPRPDGLEGLDGEAVRSLEAGDFRVWASSARRRPEPSLERIRRHDAVVRAAMRAGETPLPVRFGQWFSDPEALAASLARRADEHRRALREISGCAEVSVLFLEGGDRSDGARSPPASPVPAREAAAAVEAARRRGEGRGYLEALARRDAVERAARRREEAVAARLAGHLGDLARGQRVRGGEDPVLVRVAHLVACDELVAHRRAVRRFARELPDLRVRCSGPWPPYSFVS